MAEVKIPLVKLRANYVGPRNEERQKMGYYKMVWFDIWVKQEAEKMFVKRADEHIKGESKIEYPNFAAFTEDWVIRNKYITS